MTSENLFTCAKCGAEIIHDGTLAAIYTYRCLPDTVDWSIPVDSRRVCHSCSAELEMADLIERGHGIYYMKHAGTERGMGLTTRNVYALTAWNGHFEIPIRFYTHGKHNWSGKRTDVWFMLDGSVWHGTVYGSVPGDCHIKRTKYTSLDKVR